MNFGIGSIFQIVGSLAFFIYGMKMMSDGIQRAAGSQLRNILRTMTQNRVLGVFTGFFNYFINTVFFCYYRHDGKFRKCWLAFFNRICWCYDWSQYWNNNYWMGLFRVLGFKVKLSAYSIPLFALGVPMILGGKGKVKHWGQFIIGFAILFLGLSELKGAVPSIKDNPGSFRSTKRFYTMGNLFKNFLCYCWNIINNRCTIVKCLYGNYVDHVCRRLASF